MSSPAFYARQHLSGQAADVRTLALLHLESAKPQRWLLWGGWFAAHGLRSAGTGYDLTHNNYPWVIQAAIVGQGKARQGRAGQGARLGPAAPNL